GADRQAQGGHVAVARPGEPQALGGVEPRPEHQAAEELPERMSHSSVLGEHGATRGIADPDRARSVSCGSPQRLPRLARIWIIAGPRRTMNIEGKMQPTSGNSILVGGLA